MDGDAEVGRLEPAAAAQHARAGAQVLARAADVAARLDGLAEHDLLAADPRRARAAARRPRRRAAPRRSRCGSPRRRRPRRGTAPRRATRRSAAAAARPGRSGPRSRPSRSRRRAARRGPPSRPGPARGRAPARPRPLRRGGAATRPGSVRARRRRSAGGRTWPSRSMTHGTAGRRKITHFPENAPLRCPEPLIFTHNARGLASRPPCAARRRRTAGRARRWRRAREGLAPHPDRRRAAVGGRSTAGRSARAARARRCARPSSRRSPRRSSWTGCARTATVLRSRRARGSSRGPPTPPRPCRRSGRCARRCGPVSPTP